MCTAGMCGVLPYQELVEQPWGGRSSLCGPLHIVSSDVITSPTSGLRARTSAGNRVADRHVGLTMRTAAMCELVPCQEPVEPPLDGLQSLHGLPHVEGSLSCSRYTSIYLR